MPADDGTSSALADGLALRAGPRELVDLPGQLLDPRRERPQLIAGSEHQPTANAAGDLAPGALELVRHVVSPGAHAGDRLARLLLQHLHALLQSGELRASGIECVFQDF